MIANFFNKTKPAVTISLILCLFVYYTFALFFLELNVFSAGFLLRAVGLFLVLVLVLILMNFIVSKNQLTQDNSYALLITVFLLATFYKTMMSSNIILSNFFLLLAYRKIYSLRSGINTKQKLFDAGLWVGIAAIIYSWSFIWLLLVYAGMLMFKKIDVKNLFIPIVGFLAPVLIYFTYCFYFDEMHIFYSHLQIQSSFNYSNYNNLKLLIPISFLLTITIWSIVSVTPNVVNISNNFRISWNLILFHLFISGILIALSPIKDGSEMFFMIFPLAIIVTNFLQKSISKNFKNLVLYFFLVITALVYFL